MTLVLTEGQVIDRVCRFLEQKRFAVTQRLKESEKGIDIKATTPNGRMQVAIEAKGATSSRPKSKRYGQLFTGNQVYDHVAKAFYCSVIRTAEDYLSGVAVPRNAHHSKQINAILPALRKMEIEVFWVNPSGDVEVENTSTWWAKHVP